MSGFIRDIVSSGLNAIGMGPESNPPRASQAAARLSQSPVAPIAERGQYMPLEIHATIPRPDLAPLTGTDLQGSQLRAVQRDTIDARYDAGGNYSIAVRSDMGERRPLTVDDIDRLKAAIQTSCPDPAKAGFQADQIQATLAELDRIRAALVGMPATHSTVTIPQTGSAIPQVTIF